MDMRATALLVLLASALGAADDLRCDAQPATGASLAAAAATIAPVITSAASAHGTVASPFAFAVTALYDPTTFAATGLPNGLRIDRTSGLISGVPLDSGSFAVDVTASNGAGDGHQTLTLTIDAVVLGGPVITSASSASGTVGTAFSYTITATNGASAFTAAPLPPGLSLDAGTGVISGTPTAAGTTDTTISAANASGTATTGVEIAIAASAGSGMTTANGGGGGGGGYGGGHGCGRGSGAAGLAGLGIAMLLAGVRRRA